MPDAILPCLDEAAALPWVLDRMPPGYRAIVVDNGSSDGSARVARDHGATVVDAPQRGFGAACHAGLLVADPPDGVVCFLDADASLDPRDLPTVADPILRDEAELTIGRRVPTERAAWPAHARLANAVLAAQLRRTTKLEIRDLGPMRAARRDALVALGLEDRRFGYPLEMLTKASAASWRITEVPVGYLPRAAGTHSKVTGTVRGTAKAVLDMSRILRQVNSR